MRSLRMSEGAPAENHGRPSALSLPCFFAVASFEMLHHPLHLHEPGPLHEHCHVRCQLPFYLGNEILESRVMSRAIAEGVRGMGGKLAQREQPVYAARPRLPADAGVHLRSP